MRLRLLSYVGGLGLIAGALMWPSVSQAQGFCYLINAEGRVVNLDDLCLSDDESETLPAPNASDASTEPQDSSSTSETRNYTITSPAAVPGSSATPAQPNADPADPDSPEPTEEFPEEPSSEATPAEPSDSTDQNDRLDIPVREIETPEIPEIQTPRQSDSTDSDTDTP
ncbi:hypothetical protein VB780_08865 [Leptolyngbya sp. CCNP1308]|uniref:hypothetical protein n=1 Tax=Leptolyngbya sp. CCNP1308 TaxID=3110255 RepID=UPI002B1ED008|nr:hypothetical protein [Leptolyngbya sp. CCNP1308]MEA5448674.1 hypothetical protein [Leptolyngbya sp. CCNP1308]